MRGRDPCVRGSGSVVVVELKRRDEDWVVGRCSDFYVYVYVESVGELVMVCVGRTRTRTTMKMYGTIVEVR